MLSIKCPMICTIDEMSTDTIYWCSIVISVLDSEGCLDIPETLIWFDLNYEMSNYTVYEISDDTISEMSNDTIYEMSNDTISELSNDTVYEMSYDTIFWFSIVISVLDSEGCLDIPETLIWFDLWNVQLFCLWNVQ